MHLRTLSFSLLSLPLLAHAIPPQPIAPAPARVSGETNLCSYLPSTADHGLSVRFLLRIFTFNSGQVPAGDWTAGPLKFILDNVARLTDPSDILDFKKLESGLGLEMSFVVSWTNIVEDWRNGGLLESGGADTAADDGNRVVGPNNMGINPNTALFPGTPKDLTQVRARLISRTVERLRQTWFVKVEPDGETALEDQFFNFNLNRCTTVDT